MNSFSWLKIFLVILLIIAGGGVVSFASYWQLNHGGSTSKPLPSPTAHAVISPSPLLEPSEEPVVSPVPTYEPNPDPEANLDIRVEQPLSGAKITSPLTIIGEARGSWYFEGSFPAKLLDQNGEVIATGAVRTKGEWMTEEFVRFSGPLKFAKQPAGSTGTLVLENDNPSGLPENGKRVEIPVLFK